MRYFLARGACVVATFAFSGCGLFAGMLSGLPGAQKVEMRSNGDGSGERLVPTSNAAIGMRDGEQLDMRRP